jgi:DNA-binding transcriptional LysR family regulator
MDFNSARQFVGVVEAGSFRKAARQLDLPVSTLSDRIAGLERELGVALLVRTTRRLTVTEAGRELYDSSAAAVAALLEARERVTSRGPHPTGTLRITAPADFAGAELVAAVSDYRKRYPAVQVETYLTNRYVDLIAEQYDIAIRGGNLSNSGLLVRRIGTGTLVLVASPNYLASAPTLRHPKDILQHACVGFVGEGLSRTSALWPLRSDAGARCRIEPRFGVKASTLALVVGHLASDGGIGLIPSYLVKEHLRAGTLVRVLPRWSTAPIPVQIVVPQLRVPSLKTKEMVSLLLARLQPLLADNQ